MPTYRITTKPNLLNDGQKDEIAKFITKTHTQITGAPNYFAQVIFDETDYRRYVGGIPSNSQIWIHADIRSGRTKEQRTELITAIIEGVSKLSNVSAHDIWVYLNIMEPTNMAEFGQILPQAGEEQAWFDQLPEELQRKFSTMEPIE